MVNPVTEIIKKNLKKPNIIVVLTKERVGQGIDNYIISIQSDWYLRFSDSCKLLDAQAKAGRYPVSDNFEDKKGDKALKRFTNFISRLELLNNITTGEDYITFLHIAAEFIALQRGV